MSESPVITAIVTRPGLSTSLAGPFAGGRPDETLLVGVVLDGGRVGWGKCVPPPRTPAGTATYLYPGPFLADIAAGIIQSRIAPLLVGKPAGRFRPLVAPLDALTETVMIEKDPAETETAAAATAPAEEESVVYSRRALFTGGPGRTQPATRPEPEREQISRLLHPAIRQGVSQALLAAVALAQGTGIIPVLAQEYGLQPAGAPRPIQVTVQKGQSLALFPQVGALYYAAGATDPENEFGPDSEKLQRFTRLLSDRVAAALPEPPGLVLDVQGGLGRLYGNEPASVGKILGALYGLERAAQPCALWVQDVVLLDDPAGQIAALRTLREYVQMRGMSTVIAAGEPVRNLDHLRLLLDQQAAGGVHLHLAVLGTLDQTVRAAQLCHEHEVAFVLDGAPALFLAQLALALNAQRVAVPPHFPAGPGIATLHEEMVRHTIL